MPLYLFDNDGTLYAANGAHREFENLLRIYLEKKIGIRPDEIPEMRRGLFLKYGTPSSCFVFAKEFGLDLTKLTEATFGSIDLAECGVKCDPALIRTFRTLLEAGNQTAVWTNSPRSYAVRVLKTLGISDFCDPVITEDETWPYLKPQPEAFDTALNILPKSNGPIVLVDDHLDNLRVAASRGWKTVWLAKDPTETQRISRTITSIYQIAEEPV